MSNLTYETNDIYLKGLPFHQLISESTSKVCENLKTRLDRETLVTHLNHFLCAPDRKDADQISLSEREDYCEKFSAEISVGNADLVLRYVYLTPDLKPHWAFWSSLVLSDTCEIVFLIDTTEDQLCVYALDCYGNPPEKLSYR